MRWELLFVLFAAVNAENYDVKLGDKWQIVVQKSMWRDNHKWTITTDPGSTIKVYCEDFRMPIVPEDVACDYAKVVFDDGVKKETICSTQYNFQIYGKSSKFVIDYAAPSGGYLYCRAKSVHPPKSYETIELDFQDGVRRIRYPEVTRGEHDKAWRFLSKTGDKLSVQCSNYRLERPTKNGECITDILTIDAGNGPSKSCGNDKIVKISTGREITIRLETFPDTDSYIDCWVQVVSGPDPNEYNNVYLVEEDSSEFGVYPGTKGTTCPCGMANRVAGGRIINGTEVEIESKFPFMVSLRSTGDSHFCGGSIITPLHILTAAHCVSDRWTKNRPNPAELMPTVGVHLRSSDASHGQTQRMRVKEAFVTDEWLSGTNGSLAGDIAVLVLETPIKFSKWVSPVCLTPNQPPLVNKLIKLIGWGLTENGYSDRLREANVHVMHKTFCNNDDRETCFKWGKTSTCFGDSGGPEIYVDPETNRYTQVSLVSYGINQCSGPYFVGTNVVYWYDWIQRIVAGTSSSYRTCRKVE